jgi:hypothetical protein
MRQDKFHLRSFIKGQDPLATLWMKIIFYFMVKQNKKIALF